MIVVKNDTFKSVLDLSPEEELLHLEELIRNKGYLALIARLEGLIGVSTSGLKSSTCVNRDFIAGKVTGLETATGYTKKRIETLKNLIIIRKDKEEKNKIVSV